MATCSSCARVIYWGRTKSGARMPIDPQPVANGNIERDGELIIVVRPDKLTARFVSHYVTCPEAVKYRKASGVKLASAQLPLIK